MEKECEGIKYNALTLSWYMRGGASYEDVLNMSTKEHEAIVKLIEVNMETTGKTGLSFF